MNLKSIIKFGIFSIRTFLGNPFDVKRMMLFIKIYPFTMVGYKRLDNLYTLCKDIIRNVKDGAFVECGTWKGGCGAIMAYLAKKEGAGRETWLFDSFEGLPPSTENDGEEAKKYTGECYSSLDDVNRALDKIGAKKNTFIVKGWFNDTLPKSKDRIKKISILRLDGDWYQSTKESLEDLYDYVINGGYILLDDYNYWEGSKRAVDEFLNKRGILVEIIKVDGYGAYFQKP